MGWVQSILHFISHFHFVRWTLSVVQHRVVRTSELSPNVPNNDQPDALSHLFDQHCQMFHCKNPLRHHAFQRALLKNHVQHNHFSRPIFFPGSFHWNTSLAVNKVLLHLSVEAHGGFERQFSCNLRYDLQYNVQRCLHSYNSHDGVSKRRAGLPYLHW